MKRACYLAPLGLIMALAVTVGVFATGPPSAGQTNSWTGEVNEDGTEVGTTNAQKVYTNANVEKKKGLEENVRGFRREGNVTTALFMARDNEDTWSEGALTVLMGDPGVAQCASGARTTTSLPTSTESAALNSLTCTSVSTGVAQRASGAKRAA